MDLLMIRRMIKRKKPKFTRQDSHKKVKLGNKWRKPRGIQSKMRLHKRGYKRSPEVGYGSPKEVKGLSRDGYKPIIIQSLNDIDNIKSPTKEAAVISSKLGKKKKVEVLKILKNKNIKVLNLKDDYVDKVIKDLEERKKIKEERLKMKKAKEEAKKKEKSKKESIDEKLEDQEEKSGEEKKEELIKEKEKIITKKK